MFAIEPLSEVATAPVVSVPKATVPPLPEKDPAQAVPDACVPTLKVIDGSMEAVIETWSLVTRAIANEPLMPPVPTPVTTVTIFDPVEAELVPVKAATESVPEQAVPPEVMVKTLPAENKLVAVPVPQVTAGVPDIAEKPVQVITKVPVVPGVIPAPGSVILTLCVTLAVLAVKSLSVSFITVGEAAKAGNRPN